MAKRSDYERKKESARARSAAESRVGRDIGAIPPVAESDRREAASRSFKDFCSAYFPRVFCLPWSNDHLRVIAAIERSVLRGGLFALAMPRGNGKTSMCERAVLWAVLNGWHPYVFLIGASEQKANKSLDNLKTELSSNELLIADYPEVCYPIHCLEGQTRRCVGQLHHGQPTHISWNAGEIKLPMIPGSKAAGAIINVAGITGSIRGAVHLLPDGSSIRPTLAVIDDPQTEESAHSPSQCDARERIINGAVLNLPGPGKKISAIMPVTVIEDGDLADRMLNRDRNPEWQGERTKMVYAFPVNTGLWDQYAELRRDSLRNGGTGDEATEFYVANRKEMDAGAVVAWPDNFKPDEVSAIQSAMNLRIRDERSFCAEYQNEPIKEKLGDTDAIADADTISNRVNGYARRVVPAHASFLTAFIDIHATALYYVVAAWESDFTGYVIDYGTEPEQPRDYFSLRDIRKTLARVYPSAGEEGQIRAGLDSLVTRLACMDWSRDDGSLSRLNRILIDASWQAEIVKEYCRQSQWSHVLCPSHGQYVGASGKPFSERKRERGDRVGLNWRVPRASRHVVRHVAFDANFWKSFIHRRFRVSLGDPGTLTLWGRGPHQMFSEHAVAEYPVRTEGRGRVCYEWQQRPNQDNHLFDCVVGSAVAASMEGASIADLGEAAPATRRRKTASLSKIKQRSVSHVAFPWE